MAPSAAHMPPRGRKAKDAPRWYLISRSSPSWPRGNIVCGAAVHDLTFIKRSPYELVPQFLPSFVFLFRSRCVTYFYSWRSRRTSEMVEQFGSPSSVLVIQYPSYGVQWRSGNVCDLTRPRGSLDQQLELSTSRLGNDF